MDQFKLPPIPDGFVPTKSGCYIMCHNGVWAGWLYGHSAHTDKWVRIRKLGPTEIEIIEQYNKEKK